MKATNPEQIKLRYDFKRYCMERALDRGDWYAYSIFCARAAYLKRLLTGEPMTEQNRNIP